MNGGHEWIWALDWDTLIMNRTLTIQDHVFGTAAQIRANQGLTMDDCDLILSQDCNSWNAGNIFLRNSEWSLEFLERIIDLRLNTSLPNTSDIS